MNVSIMEELQDSSAEEIHEQIINLQEALKKKKNTQTSIHENGSKVSKVDNNGQNKDAPKENGLTDDIKMRTDSDLAKKNFREKVLGYKASPEILVVPTSSSTFKSKTRTDQIEAKKSVVIPKNDLEERFSGFKILNRRISSINMEERMKDKKYIELSQISRHMSNNKILGAWVIIGVLVDKSDPKNSSNGKKYQIWKISDLKNTTISVFLFDKVLGKCWKEQVGAVLGIVCPNILKPKENANNDGNISLELDNVEKLMNIGISATFGHCKGTRKDGQKCTMVIDKEQGDYCDYHVTAAYKKSRSTRMEFNAGYGKPFFVSEQAMKPRDEQLEKKMKTVFGPAVTSRIDPKLQEKQKEQAMQGNSVGARYLRLCNNVKEKITIEQIKTRTSLPTGVIHKLGFDPSVGHSSLKIGTPKLGRGWKPGTTFDLDDEIDEGDFSKNTSVLKAIETIRQKGISIPKIDPNTAPKLLSLEHNDMSDGTLTSSMQKRKMEIELFENGNANAINQPKKKSLLAESIGLDSRNIKALTEAKSIYSNLTDQIIEKQDNKFLDTLESKEKMIQKMDSIKEMKVKAVKCKECDYLADRALDKCKEKGHHLDYIPCIKRFFQCQGCKTKISVLNEIYPSKPCKRCEGLHFKACSMLRHMPKGPEEEKFLPRGIEHSKFIDGGGGVMMLNKF